MKNFLKAIKKFTQSETEQDLLNVFEYLPKDIQEGMGYYIEMFIRPENHTFYILTSLFINWSYKLQDSYSDDDKILAFLDDMSELFEYIDDEIDITEQKVIIERTKTLLNQLQDYIIQEKSN